ncbi:hypothetical protein [Zymomonas mobilis]|uniref:Uncharacterized protein n=1 Tax=Zymomonas mobilis subsp. pomaceae (strain ATCC 29192 / DSM 22645 / JCM 10191 / CCUG 17912 / NBRC 13757 / NCIMB 11200 / NRRL B-4491 / Barker I) TaxID=579138 RepID=F8EW56_ZYMMT|nr:hypothetical protein [Zymomonas mobilis]AEI38466.1 hypothetical protein Zymop_1576 [Zymomonas mobilis subsp. pomaceae ATCC 29192]MDX5948155.1 hypothetical protein [Zymomonas mobilis subsp. pomaceae]GEB89905.1 hypothetical protein ZMO02_15420 [Zymomonas mobilis subsp. pomaceae]
MKYYFWETVGLSLFLISPIQAAQSQNNLKDSPLFSHLLTCRNIEDKTARLQCFDDTVKTLDEANTHHDILVLDRAAIIARQRQSFGFGPPVLALPKPEKPVSKSKSKAPNSDESLNEMTDKATFVSQDNEGHWIIGFANGARWQQIDEQIIPNEPHIGSVIRLRKASFGSFVANIDKQSAVKMRRIR